MPLHMQDVDLAHEVARTIEKNGNREHVPGTNGTLQRVER